MLGMRNARPHRLPTGDQLMVPFATDPGWYRAYWYEPQPAQPCRSGLRASIRFILAVLTMAMHLSAAIAAAVPCKPVGE
jgi:hypothetical protein